MPHHQSESETGSQHQASSAQGTLPGTAESGGNPVARTFSNLQLVREIQQVAEPRQRALISLIAICDRHDIPPGELLTSFSNDLPRTPLENRRATRKFYWSKVRDLAEQIDDAPNGFMAASSFPKLLPEYANIAMEYQRKHGTQDELTQAWLNRSPDCWFDYVTPKSLFAMGFQTFLKLSFTAMVVTYVLINVIPQLREMIDEFGLTPSITFMVTIEIFDLAVKFWFLPVLILLFAGPLLLTALVGYLKRWNPFIWQKLNKAKGAESRRLLALRLAHHDLANPAHGFGQPFNYQFDDVPTEQQIEPKGEEEIDWNQVRSFWSISKQETRWLQETDSADVQSWLLGRQIVQRNLAGQTRGKIQTGFFVTFVNVLVAIVVVLLAVSIFKILIDCLQSLG